MMHRYKLTIGLLAGAVMGLLAQTGNAQQKATSQALINDYPTVARADYVFGCMAANGQTRQAMEKCACSIDLIATILPYEKYVEAETILSVGLVGGEKVAVFNTSQSLQNIVGDLRRAQVEAEFRCF